MAESKSPRGKVDFSMQRSAIQMQGEPDKVFESVPVDASLTPEALEESRAQLLATIEEYFHLVAEALADEPQLQYEALDHLKNAKYKLEADDGMHPSWALSEAQYQVHLVHVKVARAQDIREGERKLSWIGPAIIVVYVVAVIIAVSLGSEYLTSSATIPLLQVPISAVLWAALGSLSAILYRFYHAKLAAGGISMEIRWLIARPLIGIIMGTVCYMIVDSGLSGDVTAGSQSPQLLLVIAFLGGFSDRFFESILDAVVGKVVGDDAPETIFETGEQKPNGGGDSKPDASNSSMSDSPSMSETATPADAEVSG